MSQDLPPRPIVRTWCGKFRKEPYEQFPPKCWATFNHAGPHYALTHMGEERILWENEDDHRD